MSDGMSSSRTSTDGYLQRLEPIAADPRLSDDEAERDYADETFSVTSSIYDYRYENGRTYHRYKDGAYLLPNDEIEKDRLDIVHHIYLIMLGGRLTLAPIDNPTRILDVGTGTGIWAISIADHLPETCDIIGTDLSPIQPEWVPANCHFEIDDAESDWTFPPNHFDFIHSRHLLLAIRDWGSYLKRVYHHLAPGGYVELVEHTLMAFSDDDTLPPDSPITAWCQAITEAANRMGFVTNPGSVLKHVIREAGFVDLVHTAKKLPWGPWPEDEKMKEMGRWARLQMANAMDAYGMALLTRVGGMLSEDAKKLCVEANQATNDHRVHVYNHHHFFVARKPYDGEVIGAMVDGPQA
ncbi:S-adenosyl-L-methionine-dependent methyltransferase [Sphaerosporella brunnea]|uniref:S-adenosyl-L-methionine-dependent methyltransferase n=1 Tax=Sphaerosporella brunnea TaxID=1250544 RepID=A0A5J5F332_9PEZI|nr:S-adenosyl-L-methionine-dependent methyltransferase [Sphaerosporella brunnea]